MNIAGLNDLCRPSSEFADPDCNQVTESGETRRKLINDHDQAVMALLSQCRSSGMAVMKLHGTP